MSSPNQSNSPWARPADGAVPPASAPSTPTTAHGAGGHGASGRSASGHDTGGHGASGRSASGHDTGRGDEQPGSAPIVTGNRGPAVGTVQVFGAGQVTGAAPEPRSPHRAFGWDTGTPKDPANARRRTLRWFTGATGGIVAVGIVVLLALVLTGRNPFPVHTRPAPDTRPILAKLCPPPSGPAADPSAAPPTPAGPRTVDKDSGISYRAYGSPWRNWGFDWETGGELGVTFRTGQYFVTEPWPDHGDYLATILSGSVPAATNDAMTLDLKCASAQVTGDVRQAYYPLPNTMDPIVDKATTIAGRPAWLSEFRLHFHSEGLTATSEMVAIALIDVGKPNASILYVSIPGTHDQYDYVIDELLASVRLT